MTGYRAGRRMGLPLAAVAVAAVIALPAGAGAEGGAKSKIVIKNLTRNGAAGKVSSHKGACVGHRKVSLFRYESFVTEKVAITETNSHGVWKVGKNLKDGRYFAKVDASGGCRYDNSKSKRLG